jgi:hypothetical protein
MLVCLLQDFLQDREHCSEKPLVFVEPCFENTDLEDFICAMWTFYFNGKFGLQKAYIEWPFLTARFMLVKGVSVRSERLTFSVYPALKSKTEKKLRIRVGIKPIISEERILNNAQILDK